MSDFARNAVGVSRRGHRVHSLEFKQQVIKETLLPGASVSVVADRHGIHASLVFTWRRLHRLGKLGLPATVSQRAELLPVSVIDASVPEAAGEMGHAARSCCEVEVEVGGRRVHVRGLSMDRAERFLRECLP